MIQRGRAVGGVRCAGLVAGSVAAGRAHGTSVCPPSEFAQP
jgi:hypothetical protein